MVVVVGGCGKSEEEEVKKMGIEWWQKQGAMAWRSGWSQMGNESLMGYSTRRKEKLRKTALVHRWTKIINVHPSFYHLYHMQS